MAEVMSAPDAVVKVGGSLLGAGVLGQVVVALRDAAAAGARLLVVPGGGPFADAVRLVTERCPTGDSAAHWMAILAMDQHAHLLAALMPEAELLDDRAAAPLPPLAILAPYRWLRWRDPLPHSWDVTSDSIAAWVAGQVGAPLLALVKAAGEDASGETDVAALARAGVIDPHFAGVLPDGVRLAVIDGHRPERLRELLAPAAPPREPWRPTVG